MEKPKFNEDSIFGGETKGRLFDNAKDRISCRDLFQRVQEGYEEFVFDDGYNGYALKFNYSTGKVYTLEMFPYDDNKKYDLVLSEFDLEAFLGVIRFFSDYDEENEFANIVHQATALCRRLKDAGYEKFSGGGIEFLQESDWGNMTYDESRIGEVFES